MLNTIEKLFSEDDHKGIEQAVRDAEQNTSGEIVPYAVMASDDYDEAQWRAGLLFGVIALVGIALFHNLSDSWEPVELLTVAAATLFASLLGVLLVRYVEGMKRVFAGKELLERRVEQRAAEAFISEEVFDTRDRTGILLFVSLLEHKVLVLGDSGINAKVDKDEWNGIVATIVNGMRAQKPAEGLIEAIRKCGVLLRKEGVAIRPDDTNELSNKMRTSDT